YWGRRFTIIWACLAGLCFVPLWILPHSLVALSFGSFMVMVFVQGTWGCIPAHMIEISPDEFRSTFPGMSFQLANLISSPSVLILAKAGESNRLPDGRSNYAWPQLTSLCALFGIVAILTFLGTEQRAKNLEISDAPTSNAKSEVV
ncbi:Carboxylic acid transporter, partial [Spiromyces aspiralis]